MNLFNFFNKNKSESKSKKEEKSETTKVIERPRICCIDLPEETINALKKSGHNISSASLGSKIKIPDSRNATKVLLNHNLPDNLHEFDIIIIDPGHFEIRDWASAEHERKLHTGKTASRFLYSPPETVFDPRPLNSNEVGDMIRETEKDYLVIAFSVEDYFVEYDLIEIRNYSSVDKHHPTFTKSIYSFWSNIPLSKSQSGKEITVAESLNPQLTSLLKTHKTGASYNQTFHHPTKWDRNKKEVLDENFIPLMTNIHNNIISFIQFDGKSHLFMFPQFADKTSFLSDFLSEVAPSMFPEMFPYSSTFGWKKEKDYYLPNHSQLLAEKEKIRGDYEDRNKLL